MIIKGLNNISLFNIVWKFPFVCILFHLLNRLSPCEMGWLGEQDQQKKFASGTNISLPQMITPQIHKNSKARHNFEFGAFCIKEKACSFVLFQNALQGSLEKSCVMTYFVEAPCWKELSLQQHYACWRKTTIPVLYFQGKEAHCCMLLYYYYSSSSIMWLISVASFSQ